LFQGPLSSEERPGTHYFKPLTSHKCHFSHPVKICDSSLTLLLASSQ